MLGESNLEMTSAGGAFDAIAVDQIPLLDLVLYPVDCNRFEETGNVGLQERQRVGVPVPGLSRFPAWQAWRSYRDKDDLSEQAVRGLQVDCGNSLVPPGVARHPKK